VLNYEVHIPTQIGRSSLLNSFLRAGDMQDKALSGYPNGLLVHKMGIVETVFYDAHDEPYLVLEHRISGKYIDRAGEPGFVAISSYGHIDWRRSTRDLMTAKSQRFLQRKQTSKLLCANQQRADLILRNPGLIELAIEFFDSP